MEGGPWWQKVEQLPVTAAPRPGRAVEAAGRGRGCGCRAAQLVVRSEERSVGQGGVCIVLQSGRARLAGQLTLINGVSNLLEEGDESGDSKYLGTNKQRLDPLRRDLNCANTVENSNDELDILESEAEIVWRQLLVKINDVHTGLVTEEIFEVFAAGGEDQLVCPEHLAATHQRDIHILARTQVLAAGWYCTIEKS